MKKRNPALERLVRCLCKELKYSLRDAIFDQVEMVLKETEITFWMGRIELTFEGEPVMETPINRLISKALKAGIYEKDDKDGYAENKWLRVAQDFERAATRIRQAWKAPHKITGE